MFQTKVVEKAKHTFVFNYLFPKIVPFMRKCGKNTAEADWQWITM